MIDLGMVAKPRPCLILSVPFRDDEKAVVTYVARTTQRQGGRFEIEHDAPNFVPGVFDAQNVGTVPAVKLMRFPACMPADKLAAVEAAVQRWLGFAGGDAASRAQSP